MTLLAGVLARGQVLFLMWVTLSKQKWVISRERRSIDGSGSIHVVDGEDDVRGAEWSSASEGLKGYLLVASSC